jgi:uncharacterized protein YqeY
MSLFDRIKAEAIVARRVSVSVGADGADKIKANLLVTLQSEAAMAGKNDGNRPSTDDEVLKVIRKFLKGLDETIKGLESRGANGEREQIALAQAALEKRILTDYLPAMASDADIAAVIEEVLKTTPRSPKAMGAIMKTLRERFGANYDGARASELAKVALAS